MEIRPHPKREFMSRYERFEPLILDHTAISTAKHCKRSYFFQIVLGRVPKVTPVYFAFGSAYHKFREHLELSDGDFKVALAAALKVWDRDQGKDPEVGGRFDFMTRLRLMQSCAVGYKQFETERARKQIVVIQVEQPFNVEIGTGTGEYTSGRFDQIIRWNGKLWGRDFKTSSKPGIYYERGLDPNDQFTRYTYAEAKLCGETIRGQLIETLFNAKGTKKGQVGPDIKTFLVERSGFQLSDWERDELHFRKELDLARSEDVWPKNEKACGFCQFHSVCKMPSETGQMMKLQSEFDVRPWDNTKVGVTE